MSRILASIAACGVVIGCVSGPAAPSPSPSVFALRAAPTMITAGGVSVQLAPFVYRDFQPISPPDGKPMTAILRVKTADGSAFPTGVRIDSAWVLYGRAVWAATVQEEISAQPGSPVREWVVRNGPKWGPGVSVDVVVELVETVGSTSLLRASDQLVQRTD